MSSIVCAFGRLKLSRLCQNSKSRFPDRSTAKTTENRRRFRDLQCGGGGVVLDLLQIRDCKEAARKENKKLEEGDRGGHDPGTV